MGQREGETLEDKIDGLREEVIKLDGRVRLAPAWRGLLILAIVGTAWSVAQWHVDQTHQAHKQCESSNHGRAEIKQAFGDLYDQFITVSHNNPEAVKFKDQGMARINKGLPQRQC